MLLYHYCLDLEGVVFGEVKANPRYSDPLFKGAYLWLEKLIGFYPLFIAVGTTREDVRITGYQDQWRRVLGYRYESSRRVGLEYRKKGEFPNYVLFSFEDMEGIFMDYCYWHIILGGDNTANLREQSWIFKRSWNKSRWLRKAIKDPGSVQLVTDKLYLPDAKSIWVRNGKTKGKLEDMGFKNVQVKRLKIDL